MKTKRCLFAVASLCGLLAFSPFSDAQNWQQTSAPSSAGWTSVASSADGVKLVAAQSDTGQGSLGGIYTSTNSGQTWTLTTAPASYWVSVAASSDGNKLVAASHSGEFSPGPIYISTNSGLNWTQSAAPITNWACVACSADGTKLVAVVNNQEQTGNGGPIFTSTNAGANWTIAGATTAKFLSIVSSADGSKLAAVAGASFFAGTPLYLSFDSGTTWLTNLAPVTNWASVAISADGSHLVGSVPLGGSNPFDPTPSAILISTNSGTTWSKSAAPDFENWRSVACSSNAMALVVTEANSIYNSADGGATWTQTSDLPSWQPVACSADGSKFIAAVPFGSVYTAEILPALSIVSTNGGVVVSWSATSAASGLTLKQSSDLTTTNWIAASNAPAATNGQIRILMPFGTNSTQFYRLSMP